MENLVFWAVAGALVLAVLAALLRALGRAGGDSGEAGGGAAAPHPDIGIYRQQLAEVDRDLARGTLAEDEAGRLRTEISRRLLEADRALRAAGPQRPALPPGPVVGAVALVLIGGVSLYAWLGAPGYPDLPITTRLQIAEDAYRNRPSQAEAQAMVPAEPAAAPGQPQPDAQFLDLMAKLRAAVTQHPDDPRGLQLLAQNEAALRNYAAAAKAQLHLVEVMGAAAGVPEHLDAAEYLIAAAGGYVSPEAEAQLVAVLQADPKNPLARYYSGLLFAQVGRPDRAFQLWEPLLRQGPEDAPWIAPIRSQIADLAARAGVRYSPPGDDAGPTAADMQAAGQMTDEERRSMIEGMVGNLESRLLSEGGPEEEWLKLFNALKVLDQPARVKAALAVAETAFAADPAALDRLRAAAAAAGAAP
jgi:cytochrome c-type biogenesis protein CcmH